MRFKELAWLLILAPFILNSGCNRQKSPDPAKAEERIRTKTLGLAYLEENKLEEAESEFRKLIDLDPKEVLGYANLGLVYLRQGAYKEAERWLKKAIKLDPDDPDVRLILAKVYEMSDQPEKSIQELKELLNSSPGHAKALYQLTELYRSYLPGKAEQQLQYLGELVQTVPANPVPRLNLTEALIQDGRLDSALEQMEDMRRIFPEFPKESIEYYEQTLASLRSGDGEKATVSFMIFHNYLKVTAPYQAGIMELKGPGGSLIGFPVITFDQKQGETRVADWKALLETIRFTDVTSSAGLDFLASPTGMSHISVCDYDGDGDMDLYAGREKEESGSYNHFLLDNEWGIFSDRAPDAGIRHQGIELASHFADYNNDGHMDLYIVRDGSNILYRNTGKGTFEDVSGKSAAGDPGRGKEPLFFDYDHDGDLDVYIPRGGPNLLYRNNSDGGFTDQSVRSHLSGGNTASMDAAFGDFDEDGDIDLFVVNSDSSNALYSNQRQGIFKDVTAEAGIPVMEGSSAVAAGDYNNDGFLDLFIASMKPGGSILLRNTGTGSFERDQGPELVMEALDSIRARDAAFLDFDNDGYLDLLVVGEPDLEGGGGVLLAHNDGTGILWPAPGILPEELKSASGILLFDYNEDGDMDLIITGTDNGIRLLRNDGGNNNHFVKMKLVGIRTGSAKNNYFGIGAKVEVRSGSLYQSAVVTRPDVIFGLGPRKKAEVIRIVWTNGVPQNIFFPGTDQDLIEQQILKGSCPFLYTWNGEEYRFLKDVLWRSALGMPLGIMGDATAYAPPEASSDYIKIPGESLMPLQGKYSIQLTAELWETIYLDKLELVVVDHPGTIEVYVDEKFSPRSPSQIRLYPAGQKRFPLAAHDQNNADVLSLITQKDDRYVSGFIPDRFQGMTEMTDLVLDLGDTDPEKNLFLFLNGWIFPTDASINTSIAQSDAFKLVPPSIQVLNEQGVWETVIGDMGFPMGKDKTVIADLTGQLPARNARIRIRTNMEIYWDRIFFTNEDQVDPVQITRLKPSSADLHFRGYSRSYRKGGRYGPHWFDYEDVHTGQKWRDLTGKYTRYGDVLPLLLESDDKYIIKNAGDETTIAFSLEGVPGLPDGWSRDFLIHCDGWVKDGDLNTLTGNTVEPLPFHGMKRYPYGPEESYPGDREHKEYLEEFNTRTVNTEAFTGALSASGPAGRNKRSLNHTNK